MGCKLIREIKGKIMNKSNQYTTTFVYFFMLIIFVAVRIFFLYVDLPLSDNMLDILSTIIVQGGVMFLMSVGLFSLIKKQKFKTTLKDFGYNKIGWKPILLSILIGIFCYFFNIFISSFFSTIISLCGYEKAPSFSYVSSSDYSVGTFIIQVIVVALVPAICEETAHRGLLLNGFKGMGIKNAMIISSLLFGLMHLNVNQFFYATILGFLIALSVVLSKSIIPAIIIHFLNNFLSTYFSFASVNNWIFGDTMERLTQFLYGSGNWAGYLIMSILTIGTIVMILVFLYTMLLKETRIKQAQKTLIDIARLNSESSSAYHMGNKNLITIYDLNRIMAQYNIKSLNSMIFTDIESKGRKLSWDEKFALVACILVGAIVTVSTFIWGVI